jgi:hypothetical protein
MIRRTPNNIGSVGIAKLADDEGTMLMSSTEKGVRKIIMKYTISSLDRARYARSNTTGMRLRR